MKKDNRTKHGLHKHPFYVKWGSIKARCSNPKDWRYKYYGGRGIKLADYWLDDPAEFVEYLNNLQGYEDGMTLDRIDNKGNYEKGNLRWATRETQVENRSVWFNKASFDSESGKWRAIKTYKKKTYHLGRYEKQEDAQRVLDEFTRKLI
jgi:hypothetical protein